MAGRDRGSWSDAGCRSQHIVDDIQERLLQVRQEILASAESHIAEDEEEVIGFVRDMPAPDYGSSGLDPTLVHDLRSKAAFGS